MIPMERKHLLFLPLSETVSPNFLRLRPQRETTKGLHVSVYHPGEASPAYWCCPGRKPGIRFIAVFLRLFHNNFHHSVRTPTGCVGTNGYSLFHGEPSPFQYTGSSVGKILRILINFFKNIDKRLSISTSPDGLCIFFHKVRDSGHS